jgi:hypothetical protein
MSGPLSATAQDDRYRIEVLVLTHLHHDVDPQEFKWLQDYSESLDFLTPPAEEEEDPCADLEEEEEAVLTTFPADEAGTGIPEAETESEAGPDGEVSEEDPATVILHIEEMSDVMQEAWRRLRLSAPFRPEQYLSWEQGRDEPFPSLRVHDLEVVLTDDPYADLRDPPEEDETLISGDTAGDGPDVITDQEECGADAEEDAQPELPDPVNFYRLDGTVKLTRTRFLHIDLDLQLREALFEDAAMLDPVPVAAADESEEPALPQPSSFLIHGLKQSRQIRTRRMEYFDSPVLGVLVYVTGIELPEEEN